MIFQGRTQAQFLLSADPLRDRREAYDYDDGLQQHHHDHAAGRTVRRHRLPPIDPLFKSKLAVKNKDNPASDMLSWKWKKGALTTLPDLGNPSVAGGTNYWFCLGDASGSVYELQIPQAGGWNATGGGWTYTDAVWPAAFAS